MKSRFFVLIALLSFLLSACALSLAEDITPPPDYTSPTPGPTMSPLYPQTPPDLAAGAAIFAEKCAPCHGATGLGDGPMAAQLQKPPAAIGKPEVGRAAAPANWFTTVTEGNINSFMPPFKGSLSEEQRWDVVAYAISLGGSTQAEAQQGKTVYEAKCTQCHGPSGNGIPNVDLSDQATMAKLTQNDIAAFVNKGVGTMPGLGGLVSDADIYAVAAFTRGFTMAGGPAVAAAGVTPQPPTPTADAAATPVPTLDPTSAALTGTPVELTGTLAGKVTNGSGGALPGSLKAVLHIFEHDTTTQQFSEVATQEAPLAANGDYKFEKVPMPATHAFYVSVSYANTEYQSDPAFPKDGQTTFDLPIKIYDTTTDASGLVADQVHILLDYSKKDLVQVVEFYIITNPGNQSVIAAESGGPVVSVALPAGYSNLQFEQGSIGDRYIKTTDGFADTTSITPGMKQYQIVFAVELPLPKPGLFGGQKFQLKQILPVKANAVSVLVPKGVTVDGQNVTAGGTQDMGNGGSYQVFNAGAFTPGQTLDVTASGSPSSAATAATGTNSTQNIIVGIAAFGVVLVAAGGWLFWRDRQRAASQDDEDRDDDGEDDEQSSAGATQDEILDAIVALDDQLKAGNITEQAYQARRAELKARLKELL